MSSSQFLNLPARFLKTLFVLLLLAVFAGTPAFAQSSDSGQTMSVEELEAFLEKRKKELETVIANRESMLEKQAEIRAQLKDQEAKTADFEKKFLEACEELNSADPDNAMDCEKELAES